MREREILELEIEFQSKRVDDSTFNFQMRKWKILELEVEFPSKTAEESTYNLQKEKLELEDRFQMTPHLTSI